MDESYEEIVRNWYLKLRPNFINLLMNRYSQGAMSLEDAENIYQDVFLTIRDNLKRGTIRENTSWNSYIMRVGLNMASKQYRSSGKIDNAVTTDELDEESARSLAQKIDESLKSLKEENEYDLYKDPAALEVLSDELTHTPEPCASIIRFTYYSGLKDTEIIEELDRYNSASAVKAKRWQCMRDLIRRVKNGLMRQGLIDSMDNI